MEKVFGTERFLVSEETIAYLKWLIYTSVFKDGEQRDKVGGELGHVLYYQRELQTLQHPDNKYWRTALRRELEAWYAAHMINFFFPTKIAYFPTKYRFPHMCRFPHNVQISPVPYTIFPTRYVRIARSTFGMGGADLGAGAKVAAKLKCLLCHWTDDLHRFSPFFRPPFQSHPLQTATARAGSRARSVTDAAVGCRAL